MEKTIISEFKSRNDFFQLQQLNPGLIVIKLGATWCGPCKKIKDVVNGFFVSSPDNVVCVDIDVDESFDFYAYLKSKRIVNGIPALLCYHKGNTSFVPNLNVTGADPQALDSFFTECGKLAAQYK